MNRLLIFGIFVLLAIVTQKCGYAKEYFIALAVICVVYVILGWLCNIERSVQEHLRGTNYAKMALRTAVEAVVGSVVGFATSILIRFV